MEPFAEDRCGGVGAVTETEARNNQAAQGDNWSQEGTAGARATAMLTKGYGVNTFTFRVRGCWDDCWGF